MKCKKDKSKLIFTRSDGRTATYDLATQSYYNYQGRKVKSLNSFFANIPFYSITWEDEAYKKLVKSVTDNNGRLRNVGSLLNELYRYRNNESWLLLGFPVNSPMDYPISHYSKPIRRYLTEKFANPVNCYPYIYTRELKNELDRIEKMPDKYFLIRGTFRDYGILTEYDECTDWRKDTLIELLKDYNMDLKSLVAKLRYYIQGEGLTLSNAIVTLLDYNRMASKMSPKYQKYPKYLLSTETITSKNYRAYKEQYDELMFKQQVDTTLAYKGTTYSILVPSVPKDVQEEGANQHHCVASYVSSIINGNCQIVFMRLNKDLAKALLTIEIKKDTIVQVKGSYNRQATDDEMKFIQTYAKSKKLSIDKYL